MPADQVALLDLCSKLGIPFKEKKQVFGALLTVIGIDIVLKTVTEGER